MRNEKEKKLMMAKLKKYGQSYTFVLLLVMLAMIVVMSFVSPYFLTLANFNNVLNQSSIYLFLVVGMAYVIAAGEIDLSVGAIIGFEGMVMSNLYYAGVPAGVCLIAGIISSVIIGALNGWLVAKYRINSFIVTLCTMTVMRGIVLLVMNSRTRYGFGPVFAFLGSGQIGIINMPILMAIIAVIIANLIMRKTRYGVYTLFMGSNEVALSRAGVNTRRHKISIFAFSGLLAGLAGIVVMGRLNSAEPLAGTGYEMDAIAAVILGGTVLEGGKGSISGPFIACIILNIIKDGLTLLGVSTHYQEIITGVIIIISVLVSDRDMRRKSEV